MTADPFGVLGLPARPDLTDDDVRAAWRRVAAATHPDRDDGGDPDRFAEAAAAWTLLRTASGRGEAWADLTGPRPGLVTPEPSPAPAPATQTRRPRLPRGGPLTRLRHGRPLRLALRVTIAAAVSTLSFVVVGAAPAAAGLTVGALTWLLLTARHDLAPPGG